MSSQRPKLSAFSAFFSQQILSKIANPALTGSLLLSLVPAVILLVFIQFYSTNIPLTDEIDLIPDVVATVSDGFPWRALFTDREVHPIVLPSLINFLSAAFNDWNLAQDDFVNPLLASLTI
ncbi:MAG: hypothetical protein AAF125_18945, partial [Chloroflexota bacterium]